MAITTKTWINEDPVTGVSPTPLDAAGLIDLETRMGEYADTLVANRLTAELWLPTGAKAATMSRGRSSGSSLTPTSGRLCLTGLTVPRGTISSISFLSGGTPAATPTNQWFCLVDQNLNVLAKTVDNTTTAWAANTVKTLALSALYEVVTDMQVYVGIVVVAGTMPSLNATASSSITTGLAPVFSGNSTTGLTNPASLGATAAAISGNSAIPYAYLS